MKTYFWKYLEELWLECYQPLTPIICKFMLYLKDIFKDIITESDNTSQGEL